MSILESGFLGTDCTLLSLQDSRFIGGGLDNMISVYSSAYNSKVYEVLRMLNEVGEV
jgi:hypothetical protein